MEGCTMTAALLILGALPFAVGRIQDWYMSANLNSSLPYGVISLAFLSAWGLLAFLMNGNGKRTKQIVIFLNLIAAFDLVLIGIQILVLHAYWPNGIGIWTQLFYLPVLNLGFCLTSWSHGVFSAYAAGFILMVGVTFAGCKLREKGTR